MVDTVSRVDGDDAGGDLGSRLSRSAGYDPDSRLSLIACKIDAKFTIVLYISIHSHVIR